LANKFFQNIIYQMRDTFNRQVGMIDESGFVFSYSDTTQIENSVDEIIDLVNYGGKFITYNGYTFMGSTHRQKSDFIVFVEGIDDDAKRYASVLSISLSSIKQLHDEKFDKVNLIKNILLDNVLPGDVLLKSKELHVTYEATRATFLIRTVEGSDYSMIEIVQHMFPEKDKDFVISIDDRDIVLVKDVKNGVTSKELEKIAKSIVDTLNAEALTKVSVGIGSVTSNIKDIAKSYKEARVALEVGKVFDSEKLIINYENLGIARLIYQLPTTLCDLFLSEVFKKESLDVLDSETIYTIQKFFENNLNVSETSRQLYVHRNTLVYRLDKVQKLTGLDLRIFDHAIIFKVAMMVKKYLNSNPAKI